MNIARKNITIFILLTLIVIITYFYILKPLDKITLNTYSNFKTITNISNKNKISEYFKLYDLLYKAKNELSIVNFSSIVQKIHLSVERLSNEIVTLSLNKDIDIIKNMAHESLTYTGINDNNIKQYTSDVNNIVSSHYKSNPTKKRKHLKVKYITDKLIAYSQKFYLFQEKVIEIIEDFGESTVKRNLLYRDIILSDIKKIEPVISRSINSLSQNKSNSTNNLLRQRLSSISLSDSLIANIGIINNKGNILDYTHNNPDNKVYNINRPEVSMPLKNLSIGKDTYSINMDINDKNIIIVSKAFATYQDEKPIIVIYYIPKNKIHDNNKSIIAFDKAIERTLIDFNYLNTSMLFSMYEFKENYAAALYKIITEDAFKMINYYHIFMYILLFILFIMTLLYMIYINRLYSINLGNSIGVINNMITNIQNNRNNKELFSKDPSIIFLNLKNVFKKLRSKEIDKKSSIYDKLIIFQDKFNSFINEINSTGFMKKQKFNNMNIQSKSINSFTTLFDKMKIELNSISNVTQQFLNKHNVLAKFKEYDLYNLNNEFSEILKLNSNKNNLLYKETEMISKSLKDINKLNYDNKINTTQFIDKLEDSLKNKQKSSDSVGKLKQDFTQVIVNIKSVKTVIQMINNMNIILNEKNNDKRIQDKNKDLEVNINKISEKLQSIENSIKEFMNFISQYEQINLEDLQNINGIINSMNIVDNSINKYSNYSKEVDQNIKNIHKIMIPEENSFKNISNTIENIKSSLNDIISDTLKFENIISLVRDFPTKSLETMNDINKSFNKVIESSDNKYYNLLLKIREKYNILMKDNIEIDQYLTGDQIENEKTQILFKIQKDSDQIDNINNIEDKIQIDNTLVENIEKELISKEQSTSNSNNNDNIDKKSKNIKDSKTDNYKNKKNNKDTVKNNEDVEELFEEITEED